MRTLEQLTQPGDESTSSEQTQEEKEKMIISDTTTFNKAIEAKNLIEAATWFELVKSNPNYDARWLDHRSDTLLQAFCEAGQLDEAEKYIDYAQNRERSPWP